MYKERLKFYADTSIEKNKYFCFEIVSILELQAALWRFFDKGWNIRAAWYEKINLENGNVVENSKLNVSEQLNSYIDERLKRKINHSKMKYLH